MAMACFIFYAYLTGRVDQSAYILMGIWLLGGFVIQVVVGVLELLSGNKTGGNIFLFFSAFFMLVTGLEMIFNYFAAMNGWVTDPRLSGWAWLPLAATLLLWTPAYFKSPLSLLLVVLSLDIAVPLVALMDLQVVTGAWAPMVAGYALLIAGMLGLYTAAALVLNNAYQRVMLPMGTPLALISIPSRDATSPYKY